MEQLHGGDMDEILVRLPINATTELDAVCLACLACDLRHNSEQYEGDCERLSHLFLRAMIVLSWNCRDLGHTSTVQELKALVQSHHPDCVVLYVTCGV
ncbi:hypothetical protein PanWU01x14_153250 [Parasponia andersonii]|uniref:Uncharacterized protein n=1 Tax=Parasponia andersonii TaxID=3476 RepID=A0A2P5CH07_PARAD|nr:hypothetical protein PanWU01x14_153250 [Parasponia andersonii]